MVDRHNMHRHGQDFNNSAASKAGSIYSRRGYILSVCFYIT